VFLEGIKMKSDRKRKQVSKKRNEYLTILKVVLLVFASYLVIQLSNEAKYMEEREDLCDLQTTMDFVKKYVNKHYINDWENLNCNLYKLDSYSNDYKLEFMKNNLKMEVNVINGLDISESITLPSGFTFIKTENCILISQTDENVEDCIVTIAYNGDPHIRVIYNKDDLHVIYNIEYKNGSYLQNPEMEQQLEITTEEAVGWAENIRRGFEEEMQRMHDYQIEKAARIRKEFANTVLAVCGLIILWKYFLAMNNSRREGKGIGQCFNEIMAGSAEKLWKKRFVLLGMATAFWIYIIKQVFSRYILFQLEGAVNEYAAYGISAVVTAMVNALFLIKTEEAEYRKEKMGIKDIGLKAALQTVTGCIMMVAAIRLGIVIVSGFYPHEWKFYGINFGAEMVSLLMIKIIMLLRNGIIIRKQRNRAEHGRIR